MNTTLTWLDQVRGELAKVIVGQHELIETMLLGLLCHGHVLIEGNPGLAKTLTAKTLGTILGLDFKRIQATPDLTPTDILGTPEVRGPVFTHLLLMDEINRARPRTQAALLEAMAEQQVSVQGMAVKLPDPFFVLATQNPIEQEGTNPLPEAQLDRFMFEVCLAYPTPAELQEILMRTAQESPPLVQTVGDIKVLIGLQQQVREMVMPEEVLGYIVRLILETHPGRTSASRLARRYLLYGASPRGGQSLTLGAKAMAFLQGRQEVTTTDVEAIVVRSLQHRIILNFEGAASGMAPAEILRDILEVTPVVIEEEETVGVEA